VKDFPLFVNSKLVLKDYCINGASPILRITRAGETVFGAIPGDNWTVFIGNHSTYVPLSFAKLNPSAEAEQRAAGLDSGSDEATSRDELDLIQSDATFVPIIEDRGLYDGVRRILFGNGFKFWLHRLLFMDSLSYLSHGLLSQPLDRYVLVDIDDIFVGQPGTRVTAADVDVSDIQFFSGTVVKLMSRVLEDVSVYCIL
jgi:heparan sulfate N-deacetylase/N-sulfotransferase NDST2